MALDPSIALGVRPLQLPDPLAQMAQVSQIQASQRQNEMAQMQLEQLKQDRLEMKDFQSQLEKSGGNPDLDLLAKTMLKSPKYFQQGVELTKKLKEQADFERVGRGLYPELFGPAAAAPTAAPSAMGAVAAPTAMGAAPVNALAPNVAQAAPMNALAANVAPTAAPRAPMGAGAKTADQLRREIIMFSQSGDPRAKAMADVLKAQLTELNKTHTVGGRIVGGGGNVIYTAPTELDDLITKANDPLTSPAAKAIYEQRIKKLSTHTPGTSVYMPPQEKAFESELGKGQAEGLIKGKAAAQDAASIIDTVKTGRDIMKSGMITGAGADFLVNLNQGLKTAGIDMGYGDAAANSQAFTANMAGNVGKLIKQFGAGTGLSDADREFAKDMAGGRISLDAKAINRILDINERAARNSITRHNKDVKGIKTNIPLEVEMPVAAPSASVVSAPSSAIDYLRANPSMKSAFDAKYGAGAADRALRGQ